MADPLAEFLAKEQEILPGIGGAIPADPAAPIEQDFGNLAVADPPAPFFSNHDSGVDLAAIDPANTVSDNVVPELNGRSSVGPSPVPVLPKIEPENIRRWREEQAIRLEKKDADEEKQKEEWRAAAKRDLEKWYAEHEAAVQKTKEHNRKAEEEHAAARVNEQTPEAAWDEVLKLCDSKPKGSTKDVTQLKTLLLHLKTMKTEKAAV